MDQLKIKIEREREREREMVSSGFTFGGKT
jgi:hypothetical protein